MKRTSFLPIAWAEFLESADWYERQRDGLGPEFIVEALRIVNIITEHPERYPIVFENLREAPLTRFPFCIYYRVKSRRNEIVAVFHTSRDPETWQRRA